MPVSDGGMGPREGATEVEIGQPEPVPLHGKRSLPAVLPTLFCVERPAIGFQIIDAHRTASAVLMEEPALDAIPFSAS